MLGLAALYILALIYCYVAVIAPAYGYAGFRVEVADRGAVLLGSLLVLLPACWTPVRLERPSDLVLILLYLVAVVPVGIVPLLRGIPGPGMALMYAVVIVGCHGSLRLLTSGPALTGIWSLPLGPTSGGAMIWIGAMGCALVVVAGLGLPSALPGLATVYDTRAVLETKLASGGRLLNYALLWLSNVFAPWILSAGLLRRRYLLIAAGLGFEALVFGTSGFKSVLFTPALVILIWAILVRPRWRLGPTLIAAGVAGVLVGIVADAFLGMPIASGLITRRVVQMPGLLSGMYVEFFGTHGPALLTHGLFQSVGDPVYGEQPARLIAGVYFPGNPEMYANTNFWADGFANAGLGGPVLMTVILGFVMRIYDALWEGRDRALGTLLLCVPCFALSNSALLTVLLTHGLGLLCLVAWLQRAPGRPGPVSSPPGATS